MKSAPAPPKSKKPATQARPVQTITNSRGKQSKINTETSIPVRVPAEVAETSIPVRVPAEVALTMGRMWRMASGYSVAYVTNADLACELLGTNRRNLDKEAMAYYTDRKGRTFAWQIAFRTDRWDTVARRLGT